MMASSHDGRNIAGARKKVMSLGWIVFWFIFFWPLGLYFLIKRYSSDRSAVMAPENGKKLMTVSYYILGLAALLLFSAITTAKKDAIISTIVFGSGGACLYVLAWLTRKTGERYKRYIAIIANHGQTSIDTISSALGIPGDTVVKELNKMIAAGYFEGAYVDEVRRGIILARASSMQISPTPASPATGMPVRVIKCESCYAINKISEGETLECAYCGSPLKG
jgi:hypothetical protein